MRVISQNYHIDTDYEYNTFRIVSPDELENSDGKWIIETVPFSLVMAKYDTEEQAQKAMKKMHMKYSTVMITDNDSLLVYTDKTTYDELQKDTPIVNLTSITDIPNKVFIFPDNPE